MGLVRRFHRPPFGGQKIQHSLSDKQTNWFWLHLSLLCYLNSFSSFAHNKLPSASETTCFLKMWLCIWRNALRNKTDQYLGQDSLSSTITVLSSSRLVLFYCPPFLLNCFLCQHRLSSDVPLWLGAALIHADNAFILVQLVYRPTLWWYSNLN